MASITKRPNGTYQAHIYVGRDANGKQLFEFVTRDTLKECKAAAREIEQEVEAGKYSNMGKMRFAAWADKWLKLNKERLSPSTYVTYKIYVDVHYKPFFKTLKLGQVTDIHVKQYINDKLQDLSSTTVRKHIWVLRRMLDDALKGKNPIQDIKIPTKADYKPHVITDKELQLILEATKGTRNEIIILLAAWCGFRRGEIFALKWDDIDWGNNLIRIDESRCISTEGYIDKSPKSKKGTRVVAAPEYLIKLIAKYRKSQGAFTDRLFNIAPASFTDYFGHFVKRLGLDGIRFHDLRHYHASWLYSQNIPDHYAADRLGHDVHVLKSIYQHLGLDRKIEIDESIKKIMPTK